MTAVRKHKAQLDRRASALPWKVIERFAGLSRLSYGPRWYILEGRRARAVPFWQYSIWDYKRRSNPRTFHVRHTHVGPVRISTVFLGLDHRYGDGPPVLFESMTFSPPDGKYCFIGENMRRYCTWAQAVAGHKELVKKIKRIVGEGA